MMHVTKIFSGICLCISSLVVSKNVVLIDSFGESYSFAIDSNDKFVEVIDNLVFYAQSENATSSDVSLNFLVTDNEVIVKKNQSNRDYYAPVTSKEKKDLEFIITKMAWVKNPKTLWDLENELVKAGDRIDNLHPFKFLETICNDEKMCTGLKAIRQRTFLIWPKFLKGTVTSLKEEHTKYNNVLPYVEEFAKIIGVDVNLLMPLAKNQKWEELVKTVVDKVERNNGSNRYNI